MRRKKDLPTSEDVRRVNLVETIGDNPLSLPYLPVLSP